MLLISYNHSFLQRDSLRKKISKFQGQKDIEIEFRLGALKTRANNVRFDPSINNTAYQNIYTYLYNHKKWERISSGCFREYRNNSYRLRMTEDKLPISTIKKKRKKDFDIQLKEAPFDLRLSISKETPINASLINKTRYIKKCRHTFKHNNAPIVYELTSTQNASKKTWSYNVELEIVDTSTKLTQKIWNTFTEEVFALKSIY